ncbi:MAG: putative DNA-binding domain-containing protein [Gemmobacter sp.]
MQPEHTHLATQAGFHAALWQNRPPEGLHAPDPAETARRFAVYRHNVRHGLTRALAARFPVVEALLGPEFFAAMAPLFIAEAPPADPVLLRWGDALPGFLDRFPPVAHLPWLSDVARLELARGRAYHAADAAPAPSAALGLADPSRLCLVLHPSLSLLASPFPALSIWQAHQPGAAPGPLPPGPEHALVGRRPDLSILTTAIDAGTHAVLTALAAGAPLGRAAETVDPTAALTLLLCHGLVVGCINGDTA